MQDEPIQSRQRPSSRVVVDFSAILTVDGRRFQCRALQLSEFGILLEPPYPDLVGRDIHVKLILESPHPPLFLPGIVAFASKEGLEIRFKNIPPDQRFSLRSYVNACGIGILKGWFATNGPT
jgi:PilZ domain